MTHPFIGLRVTITIPEGGYPDPAPLRWVQVTGIIVHCEGQSVSVMDEGTGKVQGGILSSCTFHDPKAVADACKAAREQPQALLAALMSAAVEKVEA